MRHLTILVPDGQNKLSSIICTYKVFTKANAYWKGIHGDDLFNIQLAGSSDEITFYEGLFSVKPHTNISAITKTDLIIVSALHPNYQEAIEQNTPMIDWIAEKKKPFFFFFGVFPQKKKEEKKKNPPNDGGVGKTKKGGFGAPLVFLWRNP